MKATKLFAAIVLAVFCSCSCSASQAPLSTVIRNAVVADVVAVADDRPIPHVVLATEIDSNVADQTVALFSMINAEPGKFPAVLFEINSPGGSVTAGFLIAKAIEDSEVPVICVVDGMAASMAMYILESCSVRIMTSRSLLMAHEPSINSRLGGKADDWAKGGKEIAELLAALTAAMNNHMVHRMNITLEEYVQKVHNTEWWVTADEALKVGAVDQVVISVKEVKKALQEALPKP